jgi:hypothetical protein
MTGKSLFAAASADQAFFVEKKYGANAVEAAAAD